MKMRIFSVYDSKAEAFLAPFFMRTPGEAIRAFTDALHDEKHMFHAHAADFTLMEIGEFDQLSGQITSLSSLGNLGNGLSYQAQGGKPELVSEVSRG